MPIEVKELIVRAWVDAQSEEYRPAAREVAKFGMEVPELESGILEQLKKKLDDKKDR